MLTISSQALRAEPEVGLVELIGNPVITL